MTEEQIIQWAQQVGAVAQRFGDMKTTALFSMDVGNLKEFAALVVAFERERCAKVAEAADNWRSEAEIAAAIRKSK